MAAQSDGLYFDTTVISSTWQDTSATIPADDIGEAIGRANDLRVGAGSPHNGIQSSASLRPLRQTTGAKFDGSDDNWLTNYTAGSGANFIVALVDVPSTISAFQYVCGSANSAGGERFGIGINTDGILGVGVGSESPASGTGKATASGDLRGRTLVIGMSFNGSTVRGFSDGQLVLNVLQNGSAQTITPIRIGSNNPGTTGATSFFGGSIKSLVAGREFLTLERYLQIRNALLA